MRKFEIFAICLIATNAYGCDIPIGEYAPIVMSEYSLQLKLIDKENYQFIYKTWWTSDGGWKEKHSHRGHWECEGNNLTLNFGGTLISAILKQEFLSIPGEKDRKSKALYFPQTTNPSTLFTGRVYWPISFLEESFN